MGKKIVVVDDEPMIIKMVQHGLKKHGYEVEGALGGAEALQKIPRFSPDLIICDIMMPDMDGTEVASKLKENPETASIPIIFLSALWGQDSEQISVPQQELSHGLAKPFRLPEMLAKVQEIIGAAS